MHVDCLGEALLKLSWKLELVMLKDRGWLAGLQVRQQQQSDGRTRASRSPLLQRIGERHGCDLEIHCRRSLTGDRKRKERACAGEREGERQSQAGYGQGLDA